MPGALEEVDGQDARGGEGVAPDLAAEFWGEAGEEVEDFWVLERARLQLSCQVLNLVLEVLVLAAESEEFVIMMVCRSAVGPKPSQIVDNW